MIIATRTLRLKATPSDTNVLIEIFAPERDGNAWNCRYNIHWPSGLWSSFAAGVDSAQALVLAFQKIGVDVYFSDYHKSGKLFWDKPASGYGFPLPPAARDALVGDD